MLKVLLKKQLSEVFKGYFYDAKKNRMRSKGAIIGWVIFYILLIGGMLGVTLRNKFDASRRSRCPDMRGAHDHKEADITDLTPRSMAIYAVLSIYVGYVSAGVNNIAHISGLIFGFLLGFAMYSRSGKSR